MMLKVFCKKSIMDRNISCQVILNATLYHLYYWRYITQKTSGFKRFLIFYPFSFVLNNEKHIAHLFML